MPLPVEIADLSDVSPDAAERRLRERSAALWGTVEDAGAVRLVGTPFRNAEALERAVRALGVEPLPYVEGQSPRTRVHGNVYTSTHYPADARVPLHQELSYRAHPPDVLAFLCVTPAATDAPPGERGATPLLDGAAFLDGLPPALQAVAAQNLCYTKTMHGGFGLGKSWQAHFETADREAVEAVLSAEGARWEWLPDDALRVEQIRPMVAAHPRTGRRCWHNQLTLWHPTNFGVRGATMRRLLGDRLPTEVRWADGAPIDDALAEALRAAEHAAATRFDWHAGDLLLVDNHRVLHGREPYRGERQVLVAMGGWPA